MKNKRREEMFFSAEEEELKEEMKSKRYRLRVRKEALTRLGFKCFVGTLECLILTHTSVLVLARIYESKRVVYKQRISVNESKTVKQPLKKRLLAAAPPGSVAVVVVVVVVVFSQFSARLCLRPTWRWCQRFCVLVSLSVPSFSPETCSCPTIAFCRCNFGLVFFSDTCGVLCNGFADSLCATCPFGFSRAFRLAMPACSAALPPFHRLNAVADVVFHGKRLAVPVFFAFLGERAMISFFLISSNHQAAILRAPVVIDADDGNRKPSLLDFPDVWPLSIFAEAKDKEYEHDGSSTPMTDIKPSSAHRLRIFLFLFPRANHRPNSTVPFSPRKRRE